MAKKQQVTQEEIKALCDQCGKWFTSPADFLTLNKTLQRACTARMAGDRRSAYLALLDAQEAIMDVFLEIKKAELATEEGREWIANLHRTGRA